MQWLPLEQEWQNGHRKLAYALKGDQRKGPTSGSELAPGKHRQPRILLGTKIFVIHCRSLICV